MIIVIDFPDVGKKVHRGGRKFQAIFFLKPVFKEGLLMWPKWGAPGVQGN